jgi:hypothetical protein
MNALSPVAPRLAKLLPRLASNHDGEVIATARAIERTLHSAGLDYHGLARSLVRSASNALPPPDWRWMARACAEHWQELSDRERDFLATLAGWRCTPSPKQLGWLQNIHNRVVGSSEP